MTLAVLSHYSESQFTFDPSRAYAQVNANFKPNGLWLSDDSDLGWAEWCRGEEWGVGGLAHRTEFRVRADARVLRLSSHEEIERLADRYPVPARRGWMPGWVDWAQVVDEFDGVLITPYVWSARYDVRWYYPWDCASGCFWNLDAVELAPVVVAS